MATELKMPHLGYTMQTGKILEWIKAVGEPVEKGEPVLRIETDKVTYEVESPAGGILQKILVAEGEEVPVGFVLAVINGEEMEAPAERVEQTPVVGPSGKKEQKVRASPLARKLARELGIDLDDIKGSGPGGRISREDVLSHAGKTKEQPAAPTEKKADEPPPAKMKRTITKSLELSGIRGVVSRRMMESLQGTAQLTQVMEADVTETEIFRRRFNIGRDEGDRISFTDILIKATARALINHPILNSTINAKQIDLIKEINIGLATATDNGLVVPVIHGVEEMSLSSIHRKATELIGKAREAKLMPDEMSGGTFTVSNMGGLDITVFTPIINPPENAILGVGKIDERPAVVNGEIVVRRMICLSLTFDHRVIDGAPAALFQQSVRRYLENPYLIID